MSPGSVALVRSSDMNRETYFLSSLEGQLFEPVRKCAVRCHVLLSDGRSAILVDIDPPVIGQVFDRGDDISALILAARFKGSSVFPVDRFPCFVHIFIPPEGFELWQHGCVVSEVLPVSGWGELHQTAGDARRHSFSSG